MELEKALYKWFTAMLSKGNSVTGRILTEVFYCQMKIVDRCTFSEGTNKKITYENLGKNR